MANKVEGKLSINIDEYEKGIKKASKTTQDENKKINSSNKDAEKKVSNTSKVVIASNNSSSKSYSTLRASSVSDMDRIRSVTASTASGASTASSDITRANGQAGASYGALAREASGASNIVSGANQAIGSSSSSSSTTQQSSNDSAGRSYATLSENVNKAKKTITEFGEATKKVGGQIKSVGDGMQKTFTAPAVAMGTASATMAVDYEHSFAKVTTLLDEGKVNVKDYSDNLKKTAKEMGAPLGEFSEATYQAISAGQDYGKAVDFVGKNVKLAKGGFTDTATAVNTTTTILNTYGEKAGDITKISDKLIATQNKGKTTVGELGSALADVIPTANSAGLEFNELLGSFAHLTAKGIQTAKSGTMIRAMLDELGKSGTKSAELLKEKTGKTFEQLMKDGKSLTDVLKIVEKGAKEAGLSVGDMFGSSEASGAVKTILGDLDNFNASVEAVKNSTGATEEAYAKMMGTMKEKGKKALVGIQEAMVTFGEKLSPLMDTLLDFINKIPELIEDIDFEGAVKPFVEVLMDLVKNVIKLIDWFSGLSDETKSFALKGVLLMAMLAPLISLFGQLMIALGGLQILMAGPLGGVFGLIKTAVMALGKVIMTSIIPAIGSAISAFIAFIAPALPVIAIITAIIAVGVLLYKNWETIQEFAGQVWENVKEVFISMAEGIGQIFADIWNIICQCFDNIYIFLAGIGGTILEVILFPFKASFNILQTIFEGIKEHIRLSLDFIKALFSGDFGRCGEIIRDIFGNIKDTVKNVFKSVIDTVKNSIEKVKSFFKFEWELPKIKLPHFNWTGSFSLSPLQVPKMDIAWKSKGGIFTKPTVLGNIGVGDKHNGIGSNAEAVLPIDRLPELLGLNGDNGGFKLEIGTFVNNTEQDVPQLMKEMYHLKKVRGIK